MARQLVARGGGAGRGGVEAEQLLHRQRAPSRRRLLPKLSEIPPRQRSAWSSCWRTGQMASLLEMSPPLASMGRMGRLRCWRAFLLELSQPLPQAGSWRIGKSEGACQLEMSPPPQLAGMGRMGVSMGACQARRRRLATPPWQPKLTC